MPVSGPAKTWKDVGRAMFRPNDAQVSGGMTPLTTLILNCTLKRSPAPSNSEALARVMGDALAEGGAPYEIVRIADHVVHPGVSSDEGDGDEWPAIREKILAADILVLTTPIWMGQPSSISKRVIERMDALLSETDDDGRPVAFGRVAGFVVTGNEDGAHHVIAELAQGLIDIGYTVPGQAWTYWHLGPGPGPDYLDDPRGHEWSHKTARTAAANLLATAHALRAHPFPVPES
jgi:multimeric flavodoxin WrbA